MTNQEALIILNAVPGVGNRTIRRLVEHFETPLRVLQVPEDALRTVHGIPSKVTQQIIQFSRDTFLQNEYNCASQHRVEIITYLDETYPALLREIPDSPAVLYIKGDASAWQHPCVGLVGSRAASVYGITTARQLAFQLTEKGFTVVSGLARGIDTASHQGALQAKGKTIAVVGCGLAHVYPGENKKIFEEIAQQGAVISEFPMTVPPIAHNFPRRNRIISGLSLGIVVVEASEKSGALITADFALEQGREVFAVPGPIGNASSKGVHNLIKEGAKLITCVEDIVEDLARTFSAGSAPSIETLDEEPEEVVFKNLTDEEVQVCNFFKTTPLYIDEVSTLSGIHPFKLAAILLKLEMKGLIQQLPGKHYIKIRVKHSCKGKVYV